MPAETRPDTGATALLQGGVLCPSCLLQNTALWNCRSVREALWSVCHKLQSRSYHNRFSTFERQCVCVCVQVYNYQLKPCLPAQQMTGSVSAAHPDWARCAPFRWRLGSFRWQFEVSMRQINKMLTAGIKMGKNIEEPTVVSHCKNPVRAKLWIRLSTCLTAKPGSQVGATHRPDKQQKTCSPL